MKNPVFLEIQDANINTEFKRIANELFNNYLIQVNENRYRLIEIEFYYDGHGHNDKYTHGHKIQKKLGHWYVHPSGIDLTFGNENLFGGILMRAVEKINKVVGEEEYIIGPLNVQTELMSGLYNALDGGANIFTLIPFEPKQDTIPLDEIIQCSRIGLKAKEGETGKFQDAPYRFVIKPHVNGMENKTEMAENLRKLWGNNTESFERIKKLMHGEYFKTFRQENNL